MTDVIGCEIVSERSLPPKHS